MLILRRPRPRPLLRASVELLNAVNGLRPVLLGGGSAALLSFPSGWPTSELPGLVAGTSVLDAVRRLRRGDFRGRRGVAALLLTVASWLVLLVIRRRGASTPGPVLDAALAEVFGAHRPAPPSGHDGALRTFGARRRWVTDTVRYGPHGRANLVDIWRRPDLPVDGKAPVLVQVPGGAWMIGDRRPQGYPLMSRFAERGWICVSLGYRVSPRNAWPAHIVDVKRGLAWVREHIAEYGGDPDCVAITGGSAGGHLAALAALTPNDPEFQPGFEDADTSVIAAVPIYGRYDWLSVDGPGRRDFVGTLRRWIVQRSLRTHRTVYADASPITRVNDGAPPFFVLHGEYDTVIPVDEARDFVAALRTVSRAPVAYAELPGAQHAFDFFGSPRAYRAVDAVGAFLERVRAGRG
ncbi:alpha/beta hydrolase [Mycobacterium sp. M1]|uniref:Alpha/beta hydrolase n=1 Tax=Mycolicibacter acidiphilus TaxID=2835306 RepID=A0ABS5RP13_9MYCO|nr:alpha/beta hydrolase [Mycolicibacter acidiphilus]MBS9536032.1 alpha/beta hydrolase [Mycolicibacter acidiphilus]